MRHRSLVRVGLSVGPVALVLALPGAARAAPAEVIDLGSIKPVCAGPFNWNPTTGKCTADATKLSGLKDQDSCTAAVGTAWNGTACVASTDAGKLPTPDCGDQLPDLAYSADKKACQVVRNVPRSVSANYEGDCFEVGALLKEGNTIPFRSGQKLKVLSEKPLGTDDKSLVVAPAKGLSSMDCKALLPGSSTPVKASALIEVGSKRVGWAYGVLTLPYRFYPHDRSFESSVSLGPYFGRRWGTPGSAFTFAATATIGSVKGEIRDINNNITDTPDLQAFSVALGWMWDISTGKDTKAFKIGVFAGSDVVGASDSIKYKHNRKPWIAFQVGYDFTDNR